MTQHNYIISNTDTDSISFCKPDQTPFTKEEYNTLVEEINNISPEYILWEKDGDFIRFIVLKAKNYITLSQEGKLKIKGSALKDAKKEKALKGLQREIVDSLLKDVNHKELQDIYHKYIKIASNIQDITDWCSKRTITEKTYESDRANETKMLDIIENTEYVEGDRIFVFFMPDGSLCLKENFKGDYCKETMYNKLFKSTQIFINILPIKELFLNYSLKKNKKKLEEILKV